MIIVVEGPSAAGKTTWITAHRHGAALVGEARPGPAPSRGSDPAAAAVHWAQVNATRWGAAYQAERQAGIAVCDTDPFKLHYVWCLWQTGNATAEQWRAEMSANRQLFASQRLGIADLIPVSMPRPAVLAARRHADSTEGAGTSTSTPSWLSRCATGTARSACLTRIGSAGNCQPRAFRTSALSGHGTRAPAQSSSMP
jgi:hypothetical protein